MVKSVNVIGRGRVGTAIAARLEERGVELRAEDAELTLLCVPDTAIRDVAQGLSPGPGWIGHVSGATPLSALDPHQRRFSLHPLQTFTDARGPEQLDGAWAAVTAETDEARGQALELARTLGLEPFELADADGRSITPVLRWSRPSWSRCTRRLPRSSRPRERRRKRLSR